MHPIHQLQCHFAVESTTSRFRRRMCCSTIDSPRTLGSRWSHDRGVGSSSWTYLVEIRENMLLIPRTAVEREPCTPAGLNLITDAEWATHQSSHPFLQARLNHAATTRSATVESPPPTPIKLLPLNLIDGGAPYTMDLQG
jgi:hypothetical protein